MSPQFRPLRAMRRKGFASSLALAMSLAGAGALAAAIAAPAQAQSDSPSYSKKFAKAAQPVSDALNAARNKPEVVAEINNLVAASNKLSAAKGDQTAPALAELKAVAARLQAMTTAERASLDSLAAIAASPDETFKVGEYQAFLGNFTGDPDLQAQGYRREIDSGVLKPEKLSSTWFTIGKLYYDYGRFAEAPPAFQKAYEAGDDQSALYATESYYAAGQIDQGLDYLKGVIEGRLAAGRPVELTWAGNGLNHARNGSDIGRTAYWAALYARTDNKPASWNVAIALLMDNAKLDQQAQLDMFRLMNRTNALVNAKDYFDYVQAAMGKVGVAYPGEVVKIAQAAIASGKVDASDAFLSEALANAQNLIPADKKSLPDLEKDGRSGANGGDALAAADAYLSYDMSAKAEEMYTLALTKGGIDADLALTRLAIAEVDQQNYAAARANFAKVSGVRKAVADMWLAWLDTVAAPGA